MLELDARLAQVMSGTQTPANALETVEFAKVAARKQLHGASAQLWLSAFDADAELAKDALSEDLYDAACSLAMAGCQQGKDAGSIDSETATSWRGQALRWLNPQLEHWRLQLDSSEQEERDKAIDSLKHWKHDRYLVGVRDEALLEKLPKAERTEWRAFWAATLDLLASAKH